MRGELKDKVARGVAWSIGEKVGSALLQLGVSIVVLRHLQPAETGVWAILTAIAAVALIVVDSGFSQALIRKEDPSPGEYKSVFLFNVFVSLALYLLLAGVSPLVARFYDMPLLASVAPVFFLLLPVNALCVIQNTIFTRQMRFASLSKVIFAASLVSGVIAVMMAVAGLGLWSFVGQRVSMIVVRTALLWWLGGWRPRGRFEIAALRRLAPFSLSLMATDLVSTLYNKVPQFFLGKLYPSSVLGYFDQALKLRDQPLTSAMQSVQNVTYPALSKIGDDAPKFAESYRQVLLVTVFLLFPVMAGMIGVSEELFSVLLTDKWLPTVPLFRVVCLTGFFYPVAMIAYNVMKVRSDGRVIVRLEIVKKTIMTLLLVVTLLHGVTAVAWGLVAMSCIEMCLNVGAARRFTLLSIGQMLRTLLPVVAITVAMSAAVWGVGEWVDNRALRLVVKIVTGVVVYAGLASAGRLEAFREVREMVRRQLRRD